MSPSWICRSSLSVLAIPHVALKCTNPGMRVTLHCQGSVLWYVRGVLNKKPLCGMGRLGLLGPGLCPEFSPRASVEGLATPALLARPLAPNLALVSPGAPFVYLCPFLHLPPVWGPIMEEGRDLWPSETHQRDSPSGFGWMAGWPGHCLLASLLLTSLLSCSRAAWCCEMGVGRKAGLTSPVVVGKGGRREGRQAGSPCLGTPFLPVALLLSES